MDRKRIENGPKTDSTAKEFSIDLFEDDLSSSGVAVFDPFCHFGIGFGEAATGLYFRIREGLFSLLFGDGIEPNFGCSVRFFEGSEFEAIPIFGFAHFAGNRCDSG